MDHHHLARLALTALCAFEGVAQLAIDLNRTHASNPDWPGHARFHVVWQSISVGLLAAIALFLIWSSSLQSTKTFHLAATLAAVSPGGFIGALVSRRAYGGRLSDPNGIPPLKVPNAGSIVAIDMNLVAVIMAFLAIGAILLIYGN